ncbi:poly polymerase catalytic domain-containing protein [Chytridium lagenaria]|nr:poly polymerase catalytic domain-containing protein [Chytridium lagenaria]
MSRRRGGQDKTTIFENLVFTLTSGVDSDVAKLISDNGGSVVQSVTKKLTHLVATPAEFNSDKPLAKVKNSKARPEIVIVSPDFIRASIKDGKVLDVKDFPMDVVEEEAKDEEESKPDVKRKRAKEDEEEDEEEEEKKPKAKAAKKAKAPAKASAKSKKNGDADAMDVDDDEAEEAKEEKKAPEKEVKMVKQIMKGKAPVDPGYYNPQAVHVLEKDGVVYDAMLNQTNVQNNNNKFYVIQVLVNEKTGGYISWNRWGRVGEKGQSKDQSFSSADAAIKDFESKFKSKTANNWGDRESFEKKYYLLERSWGDDSAPAAASDDKEKEDVKVEESALEKPVQDLMKLIFDLKMMGYNELQSLAEELLKASPNKSIIYEHTNMFFSIIPMTSVKEKIKMVEALADIQVTTTLLDSIKSSTVNPVDQRYESLKCKMKTVDQNSHLEKPDGFEEVGQKLHNRKLLWHGSRLTNFVGILSQGLRIAPPEAPVTGYMFGKGVYFADMSSPTGLLLLCDVALGDENALVNADYHAGELAKKKKMHSTWGKGKTVPDPAGFVTLEDGVVVPCGKETQSPDKSTYLQYNEFIVYDIRQIRLRYLVKMKFDY